MIFGNKPSYLQFRAKRADTKLDSDTLDLSLFKKYGFDIKGAEKFQHKNISKCRQFNRNDTPETTVSGEPLGRSRPLVQAVMRATAHAVKQGRRLAGSSTGHR